MTNVAAPRRFKYRIACSRALRVALSASRNAREKMLVLPDLSSARMSTISTGGSWRDEGGTTDGPVDAGRYGGRPETVAVDLPTAYAGAVGSRPKSWTVRLRREPA